MLTVFSAPRHHRGSLTASLGKLFLFLFMSASIFIRILKLGISCRIGLPFPDACLLSSSKLSHLDNKSHLSHLDKCHDSCKNITSCICHFVNNAHINKYQQSDIIHYTTFFVLTDNPLGTLLFFVSNLGLGHPDKNNSVLNTY